MIFILAWAWAGGLVDVGDLTFGDTPAEVVNEAREAFGHRDFARAALLYGALAESGGGNAARMAQAVSLYEGGDIRGAQSAAEAILAREPGHLGAGNLLGLTLVDGGRVVEGLAQLERVRVAAGSDPGTAARAGVNIGLALLDQGDAKAALAAFAAAEAVAPEQGDVVAAIAAGRDAASGLSGLDAGVGRLLARGDVGGARKRAASALGTAVTPRQTVAANLDLAAVERAEGDLDAAAARLAGAVSTARSAGMAREVALGLGNLGLVYSLGGRLPLAVDSLRAGVERAREGGYRVVEVDLRVELGLVLLHLGRLAEAEVEQRAAGALLAAMDYGQGASRQAELGGVLAAARGDVATARTALSGAAAWHSERSRVLDAARVATHLSAALQGVEPAEAEVWAKKAMGWFSTAGDRLGPAHVALARALADARGKRLVPALRGFGSAAETAERVGGSRGQALARIARENAAQTLVMLGGSEDVARLAAEAGLEALVAREVKMRAAFDAYDAGRVEYDARRYDAAQTAFVRARTGFDALGEKGYALRASRAAVWSRYNAAVAMPVAQAYPIWQALVDDAAKVEDPELYARAYGAAALATHTLGKGDPVSRLAECGRLAQHAGVPDVAARCHGAIAERPGDLDARAREARAAFALAPADAATVYALYAVSVDAFNGDRLDLALELAKLARPNAGALADALDKLIAATSAE